MSTVNSASVAQVLSQLYLILLHIPDKDDGAAGMGDFFLLTYKCVFYDEQEHLQTPG